MKEFLADRKGAVALIVIVVLVVAVIVAAHVSAPEGDRQEVELGSVLLPPGGLFPAGGEETSAETVEPDEDQVISREGVQSITDRVCDTAGKLVPGVEYEIVTTLMQDNGEPVLDANGHPVTVTTMFTPKSGDDCAEIVIEFDASLVSGNKVVVFEEAFLDGVSVAIHHDLEDTAQTLTFEQAPPVEETPPVEPTGASSDLAFTGPNVAGLGIAGLLLAGLGTALVYQVRREKI